jgi:hypothetical protein
MASYSANPPSVSASYTSPYCKNKIHGLFNLFSFVVGLLNPEMRMDGSCAVTRNKLMNITNPIVSDWPNFVFKCLNLFHVWLTQYYRPWNSLQPLGCTRNPTSVAHLTTTRQYKKPHNLGKLNNRSSVQEIARLLWKLSASICLISLLRAGKVQLPHFRIISLIPFLILLPHLHQKPGLCVRSSDQATGYTTEEFLCNFTLL